MADGPTAPPVEPPAADGPALTAADLGLTLEPLSPDLRRQFEIAAAINVGVVITSVARGSLAEERGIIAG